MEITHLVKKKVLTIGETSTLRDVWKEIFTKEVNGILVVDKRKRVIGIVCREDILHALYPDYQEYVDELLSSEKFDQPSKKLKEILSFSVKKVMQKNVIFCRLHTPVMRALARMIARRIDQLPVLDEKDRLVGVVSKKSVFNMLYRKHKKLFGFTAKKI